MPDTNTLDDVDLSITERDVREAEQAALDAQSLVDSLENKVMDGDDTITIDQIEAEAKLAKWARLRLEQTRRLAERARVARRIKALRELKAEILDKAPKNGDHIADLLVAVEDAARAFLASADAHDAQLRDWRERIEKLGISEGENEQGLGLNGIGQVTVGSIVLDKANGPLYLNSIFVGTGDPYGRIQLAPPESLDRRDGALRTLRGIGKEPVK